MCVEAKKQKQKLHKKHEPVVSLVYVRLMPVPAQHIALGGYGHVITPVLCHKSISVPQIWSIQRGMRRSTGHHFKKSLVHESFFPLFSGDGQQRAPEGWGSLWRVPAPPPCSVLFLHRLSGCVRLCLPLLVGHALWRRRGRCRLRTAWPLLWRSHQTAPLYCSEWRKGGKAKQLHN